MRYELLLAFRGLAAVWVLLCHSISEDYTHLAWTSPIFRGFAAVMQYGFFGVSIFFLISGYGIAGSMERHHGRAWPFLRRRIKRIFPPYWISMALVLVEVYFIRAVHLQKGAAIPSWPQILKALPLLTIPGLSALNPVYWSLGYEMHFYLLAALSIVLCARKETLFLLFDLFSLCMLFALIKNVQFGRWDDVFVIRYYWFDFFSGILLYRLLKNPHHWLFWIYAVAWQVVLWKAHRGFTGRYFVSPVVFALLLALWPLDQSVSRASWMKPIFWLGSISFSLFLTNVMVGPKFIGLMNRLTIMTTPIYLVFLLVGSAGSLALAYGFYRWIEHPLAEKWG